MISGCFRRVLLHRREGMPDVVAVPLFQLSGHRAPGGGFLAVWVHERCGNRGSDRAGRSQRRPAAWPLVTVAAVLAGDGPDAGKGVLERQSPAVHHLGLVQAEVRLQHPNPPRNRLIDHRLEAGKEGLASHPGTDCCQQPHTTTAGTPCRSHQEHGLRQQQHIPARQEHGLVAVVAWGFPARSRSSGSRGGRPWARAARAGASRPARPGPGGNAANGAVPPPPRTGRSGCRADRPPAEVAHSQAGRSVQPPTDQDGQGFRTRARKSIRGGLIHVAGPSRRPTGTWQDWNCRP